MNLIAIQRLATLVFIGISTTFALAQQTSPIRMLANPLENKWTLSGAGGGNLYSLAKVAGAASGILGLDGNIKIKNKIQEVGNKAKDAVQRIQTLGLFIKGNFFNNTSLRGGGLDSLDIKRLVFQDNDFRFSMGARYNFLKQKAKNPDSRMKTFATGFLDMLIVPYAVQKSDTSSNTGFTTISLNMGGKFGFLTKFGTGLFGMTINPQFDMLFVAEKNGGTSLMELTNFSNYKTIKVAHAYAAVGVKIEIPLNDFAICFDFRKYFKMGSGDAVANLTDKVMFSVGGMATGSIFKNHKKDKANN